MICKSKLIRWSIGGAVLRLLQSYDMSRKEFAIKIVL